MTLLFPLFRFALVTPLLEFGRYRQKTTSTLIHLSEKWETTHAVKLSLYSPNDFAPVVFPRDWTAMPSIIVHVLWWLMGGWLWFTFFCKILTRSYLLDASLRHLSSVAIDSGTGECSRCKRVSTLTSRSDSKATTTRLNRYLSALMATVLSLSSETGTEYKVSKVFDFCCLNCHETLLLS